MLGSEERLFERQRGVDSESTYCKFCPIELPGQLKKELECGKLRERTSQAEKAKKMGTMFEKKERRNSMEKVDICVSGYQEQGGSR